VSSRYTSYAAVRRALPAHIALWATQIAVGGMFLFVGSLKLAGAPAMVTVFDAIGIGQWFRVLTGSIEVVAGAALLVPSLAPFGALLLVPTMVGAIATHLFVVGGSPLAATLLLIGSLVIAWARRDQLIHALATLRGGARVQARA
jgi:putative oxidoreductase